jgi:hypothetical protein
MRLGLFQMTLATFRDSTFVQAIRMKEGTHEVTGWQANDELMVFPSLRPANM